MLLTLRKILLILFCLVFLSISLLAQKEGNIWYFGYKAGLDFNSGSPKALSDGMINTLEGCATISDINGCLLFYTDGITIWNKNHQIMTNGSGLLGHSSSTQSGVIVPKPGSNSIYFVFTVNEVARMEGINYSIVDMSLSGGLGEVTIKNFQLITPALEKLTAVKHANQTDIWVIVHEFPGDAFYSYLVTSLGIIASPVISHSGVPVSQAQYCRGYMKASPDGRHLAVAHSWSTNAELFNFDNATGMVSNPVTFAGFNFEAQYGIEFSPSSQLLYIGEWYSGTSIYQYDLNAANIAASRIVIGTDSGASIGALQLGPDGRIYVAVDGRHYLGLIKYPDILGIGCSFALTSINLGAKLSGLGLPTFNQSYFASAYFLYDHLCYGDLTQFNSLSKNYDSLHWDFGDTLSGVSNFSDSANPAHKYSRKGNYSVKLFVYTKGKQAIYSKSIEIIKPEIDLGKDTFICPGDVVKLEAVFPDATFKWQDGSTNSTFEATTIGTYWVLATHKCGIVKDTIKVFYKPLPKLDLGNDTIICEGTVLVLNAYTKNASYFWQDSTTKATYNVTDPRLYKVTINIDGCTLMDSIEIGSEKCDANLIIPNVFTPNNDQKNDYFEPVIIERVSMLHTWIYDRWGLLVYKSENLRIDWDGHLSNGQPALDGTYYWIIEFTDIKNYRQTKAGTVTVFR